MKTIMNKYVTDLIKNNVREENRGIFEHRKITVEKNPLVNACGSARVKIGKTDVIVGVMMSVGTPFPDTPDAGILMVNSELSPLASPKFELGPPRENSIELARVTDRMIRESKMIDLGKLCITPKEKVWMVLVDLYPVNADGNLFDAAALAAVIALNNAKIPKYDEKAERVEFGQFTSKNVPILKKPIMCTFGKINGELFLDPSEREEEVMDARLCIALDDRNTVNAMQKGGSGTFTFDEVAEIVKKAKIACKSLRSHVK